MTQPRPAPVTAGEAEPTPVALDANEHRPVQTHLATALVVTIAAILSVLAYLHFYPGGLTVDYNDAKSHLLIARSVIFAVTPGAGQLGGVWLPLPHILMLPLVWNTWAYYSGFAGSVVMMICYVIGTLFAYKFTWRVTGGSTAAAITGAAVFAVNPGILYMQSTPMTELLMFATMLGSVYGLLCWIQTSEDDKFHHLYLIGAGFSALLCALTRYEGWTMAVTLAGIVLYCSLARLRLLERLLVTAILTGAVVLAGWFAVHFGVWGTLVAVLAVPAVYALVRRCYSRNEWQATEGQVLAYGILGAAGPLTWMVWNWAIFGDPFAFQNGPYAKPSNWVSAGELTVHNLWISLHTYEIATVDNLTVPVAVLAVLGLAVYVWRTRLSPESLPALSLLIMFPMFVTTLYKGERPLHVPQYYGAFSNVRFGLVMLLPACIFIGYLVASIAGFALARWPARRLPRWRPLAPVLPALAIVTTVGVTAGLALHSGNIATLQETLIENATPTEHDYAAAGEWLRAHYAGGMVLMESYGNETVSFDSRIPLQDQVNEGSYRIWQPSLENPAGHDIYWIVMRDETSYTDQVYKSLHGSTLIDGYRLAWQDPNYLVYQWRGTAAQLAAAEQR